MPKDELKRVARARLSDARALLDASRFDGAVYLCGYAIEVALKARICQNLRWPEYIVGGKYHSLKTHDLDVLLSFSGTEAYTKTQDLAEWNEVCEWDPEVRYEAIGTALPARAERMVAAAKTLLEYWLRAI